MEGNLAYLNTLSQDFIVLQEHWLWEFECDKLKKLLPGYDAAYRASDSYDNILPFQRPRGQGGVAVLFKESLRPFVTEIEDGTERILPILFETADFKLCIISVYLPVQGDSVARAFLLEALDVIYTIMSKFQDSHTILVAGDFNSSMVRSKPQDDILKDFIGRTDLVNLGRYGLAPTFFSHNGIAQSQIDYMFTTHPNVFTEATIMDDGGINLSSHVALCCATSEKYRTISAKPISRPAGSMRLRWNDGDLEEYNSTVETMLKDGQTSIHSTDEGVRHLVSTLQAAARLVIPSKAAKLKGPQRKLSQAAMSICKEAKRLHQQTRDLHQSQISAGTKQRQREIKRELRSQLRAERAEERRGYIQEIMDCEPGNPAVFAKLINRQKSPNSQTQALMVNGMLEYDSVTQCEAWADYIERLATPLQAEHFDDDYHRLVTRDVEWIKLLCENSAWSSKPITQLEVRQAIHRLRLGKAAGIDDISPEHMKYATDALTPYLTDLFNRMRVERRIPDLLKKGVMTPVGKKGKNLLYCDSHRGITVTEIVGKLLEDVYKNRENVETHPLQFGFTPGLSPTMAALVLSEGVMEAKATKQNLYVAALDSQKAFDVVSHPSLLRKLFLAEDIDPESWMLLAEMQNNMTTAVKWKGCISRTIEIKQGVRQGGILSPGLYKRYVDGLLRGMEAASLGLTFGELYAGCPTVADDVLLMATNEWDLQAMLDIADDYACRERYNIQPAKSSVTQFKIFNKPDSSVRSWTLGTNPLPITKSFTHLGITRFNMDVKDQAITDKVKLARRTAYALMGTGLHGRNGLAANVSLKIYKCYVLPRMLYGIEAMNLDTKQLKELEQYHIRFLRQIQSLPDRTARCGVYILLGTVPMEAYYHLAILSLLGRILRSDNCFITELAIRQTAVHDLNSNSWFIRAAKTLHFYGLPPIHTLAQNPPSKEQWRDVCKRAVFSHWKEDLTSQAVGKTTLVNLSLELRIGVPHPLWQNVNGAFFDIKKAIIKAKLLTKTYTLQINKSRFNKYRVDPTCPVCGTNVESLNHFILHCPKLQSQRVYNLGKLSEYITEVSGRSTWIYITSDDFRAVRFILDASNFIDVLPELKRPHIHVQQFAPFYYQSRNQSSVYSNRTSVEKISHDENADFVQVFSENMCH